MPSQRAADERTYPPTLRLKEAFPRRARRTQPLPYLYNRFLSRQTRSLAATHLHSQSETDTSRSWLSHAATESSAQSNKVEHNDAVFLRPQTTISYLPRPLRGSANFLIGFLVGASTLAVIVAVGFGSSGVPRSPVRRSAPSMVVHSDDISIGAQQPPSAPPTIVADVPAELHNEENFALPRTAPTETHSPGTVEGKRDETIEVGPPTLSDRPDHQKTRHQTAPRTSTKNDERRQLQTSPEGEEGSTALVEAGPRFVDPHTGYSLILPPGFTLLQSGQRTIWRGPKGTRVMVETTSSPGRSARSGWELLHRVLTRKYRHRYRLHGITDTQFAGRPAAAWEFELKTELATLRKLDIAVLDRGKGYGVLVSAPIEHFEAFWPQFAATLRSFRLPPADFHQAGKGTPVNHIGKRIRSSTTGQVSGDGQNMAPTKGRTF
jgi:hypothetical protein